LFTLEAYRFLRIYGGIGGEPQLVSRATRSICAKPTRKFGMIPLVGKFSIRCAVYIPWYTLQKRERAIFRMPIYVRISAINFTYFPGTMLPRFPLGISRFLQRPSHTPSHRHYIYIYLLSDPPVGKFSIHATCNCNKNNPFIPTEWQNEIEHKSMQICIYNALQTSNVRSKTDR